MKTPIVIGGFFALAFFVFHIFFWRLFDWKNDLSSLTPVNRAVMQILNLCLMVVFLVFAYVSIFHAGELLTTGLGRAILVGIALLWFLRAIMQIVFFGLRNAVSVGFFIIFLIGTGLYLLPLLAPVRS